MSDDIYDRLDALEKRLNDGDIYDRIRALEKRLDPLTGVRSETLREVTNFYDAPLAGLADFEGVPHRFEAIDEWWSEDPRAYRLTADGLPDKVMGAHFDYRHYWEKGPSRVLWIPRGTQLSVEQVRAWRAEVPS